MPLPLVKILDETAAGGFNGVRLTGFPEILQAQRHVARPVRRRAGQTRLEILHGLVRRAILRSGDSTTTFASEPASPSPRTESTAPTPWSSFRPDRAEGAEEAAALRDSFAFLNELGKMAVEEYGIRMGLHNHTDSLVENQRQVDRFLEGTDPRYVFCAWDSAHLLLGGCDVQATYKKSIDRLVYTDFKDATLDAERATTTWPPTGSAMPAIRTQASSTTRCSNWDAARSTSRSLMQHAGRGQVSRLDQPRSRHDSRLAAESWRISMDYITRELDPIYQ